MKKGIAVPYIIAILLGVAVIGLIGYWLFLSGKGIGTGAKETECNSELNIYCSDWLRTGSEPSRWDGTCNAVLRPAVTTKPDINYCKNKGYNIPVAASGPGGGGGGGTSPG